MFGEMMTQSAPGLGVPDAASCRVGHYAVYLENPYGIALQKALAVQGVSVELHEAPTKNASLGPIQGAFGSAVIHWHWLALFYQRKTAIRSAIRLGMFVLFLGALRLRGTKMVLTVHNLVPHDSPAPALHAVANRCLGLLMNRLLVHSPEAAEAVAKSYGTSGKIRWIEHVDYGSYVSPRILKQEARKHLQLSPQSSVVVCFGELRPYKGIERLIEAAGTLEELGVEILITGRPYSEAYGKTIQSLASGRRNIHLRLQWQSKEDLAQVLSAADAAVFAYAESLTSGAAHMALAYELPMAAPETVAFAELSRLGLAFTFPKEASAGTVSEAVTRALSVHRETFASSCSAYRGRCSLENVGAKLRDVYQELVPDHFPSAKRPIAPDSRPDSNQSVTAPLPPSGPPETAKQRQDGGSEVARTTSSEQRLSVEGMTTNLRQRTVRNSGVTIASQGIKFSLRVGATAVMARLLTPADFGIVAMTTVVTGFFENFKDAGLSMATVQQDDISHAQVSALFWINLGLAAVIALLLVVSAPLVAAFYGEPRCIPITLVIAGASLFSGWAIQHLAIMRRNMQFARLAMIEILSMVAGTATAIAMAWMGTGYWSLVGMIVGTNVVSAVLSTLMSGWKPSAPWVAANVRSCLAFGLSLTGSSFIGYVRDYFPRVVIGRVFDASMMGLYTKAQELMMIPVRQGLPPILAVITPVLCRLQNDPNRFRKIFNRVFCAALLVCYPLAIVAVVNASEIVSLFLGPQWHAAVPLVQAFSLFAVSLVPGSMGSLVLTSLGKADALVSWNLKSLLIAVASVLIALPFGLAWIAFSLSATSLLIRVPAFFLVIGKHTCVRTGDLFRYTLTFSSAAAAAILAGSLLVSHLDRSSVVSSFAAGSGTALILYLFILWMLPAGRATIEGLWDLRSSLRYET